MKSKEEVSKIILKIASEHSGIIFKKLHLNCSINSDLQIDGDDIEEFIHKIDDQFNLNFDDFDFKKYFNSESDISIFSSLMSMFRCDKNANHVSFYDVTLEDLVNWSHNGYWSEKCK